MEARAIVSPAFADRFLGVVAHEVPARGPCRRTLLRHGSVFVLLSSPAPSKPDVVTTARGLDATLLLELQATALHLVVPLAMVAVHVGAVSSFVVCEDNDLAATVVGRKHVDVPVVE